MILYSTDKNLAKARKAVMSYLPSGTSSWINYHEEAANLINRDIKAWHRDEYLKRYCSKNYISFPGNEYEPNIPVNRYNKDVPVFDPYLLDSGYSIYYDAIDETVSPVKTLKYRDRVLISDSEKTYLWKGVDGVEVDLSAIDFSTSEDWAEVYNDLKLAGTFKALELICAAIATDSKEVSSFERYRDYYSGQYKAEIDKVIKTGLGYDFDNNGVIDTLESQPSRREIKAIVGW